MQNLRERPVVWISSLLLFLVLWLRLLMVPWTNHDIDIFLRWIDYIETHGYITALRDNFSNYPPAYLYLLSFVTFLLGGVSKMAVIKLIPLIFDLYAAFIIFKIARLKFPHDDRPFLLAAIFFGLPTVMINSSAWGQIDMLYGAFLLTCVYFLLVERPFWAMCAFAVGFSFKSQSIFLLPFLGILALKGRMRWQYFLVVPLLYILLAIPLALIGRPWPDILTIYINQVSQYHLLSVNAPNLYIFFNEANYETGVAVGMLIALLALAVWAFMSLRSKAAIDKPAISLLALTAVTLVPFVLPKMHERYFYPADILSFVAAIFLPELWFVPLLYQVISGLAYGRFLLNTTALPTMVAAIINTVTLGFLLWKQYQFSYRENKHE